MSIKDKGQPAKNVEEQAFVSTKKEGKDAKTVVVLLYVNQNGVKQEGTKNTKAIVLVVL